MAYYDVHGQEINFYDWAKKLCDDDYSVVQIDTVDGIHVSTRWIGINMGHCDGPIKIYETAVFSPEKLVIERYSSREESRMGHHRALASLTGD